MPAMCTGRRLWSVRCPADNLGKVDVSNFVAPARIV